MEEFIIQDRSLAEQITNETAVKMYLLVINESVVRCS